MGWTSISFRISALNVRNLFYIARLEFFTFLIDGRREDHLYDLEIALDRHRRQASENQVVDEFLCDRKFVYPVMFFNSLISFWLWDVVEAKGSLLCCLDHGKRP